MAEAQRAMSIWRQIELKALLAKLLRSDKLRTSAAFAAGAVAFALGNLLLAHHLQPAVYGIVALMVAIAAVGGPLAPLGLAIMVVRDRTPADRRLLLYCLGTSTLVALRLGRGRRRRLRSRTRRARSRGHRCRGRRLRQAGRRCPPE